MTSSVTHEDDDISFALQAIEEGAQIRAIVRSLGIAESILRSRRN